MRENTPTEDRDLVLRTLRGEHKAFDELTRRHQGMVKHLIARHASRAEQDVEDLTQQAFITAYRKLEHLKDPSRFDAWLWGITSRVSWKWSAKERSRPKALGLEDSIPAKSSEGDAELRSELRRRIAAAIATLAPEYQEVMLLRYLDDLDGDEIAQITDRTPGSVRGILQRGTKLLRDQLVTVWNELYPDHALDTGSAWPLELEQLLDARRGAVMVISEDHEILAVNAPYSQQFGFPREKVVGRKCYEVSHGRETPCSGTEHPCPMDLIKKSSRQVAVTHFHVTADGGSEEVDIVTMPVAQDLTSGKVRRYYVETMRPRQKDTQDGSPVAPS